MNIEANGMASYRPQQTYSKWTSVLYIGVHYVFHENIINYRSLAVIACTYVNTDVSCAHKYPERIRSWCFV